MSETLQIPNAWREGIITQKGLGLLSKLIHGNTLNITKAETGAGYVAPELLSQQTAVSEPMQLMTFKAVSYPEEGKCMVPCKLTNENIETSYVARQIGLYAEDPDEGEILFYITQVADENGGTGIPAAKLIPSYSATWNLVIYYGMADGVNVTVDPAGSVTEQEMKQYVEQQLENFTGGLAFVLGETEPEDGPTLWFDTTMPAEPPLEILVELGEIDGETVVTALIDDEEKAVENIGVNTEPTEDTYSLDVEE